MPPSCVPCVGDAWAMRLVRQHGAVVLEKPDASLQLAVVGEEGLPWPEVDGLEDWFDEPARQAVERGTLEVITETQLWQRLGLVDRQQEIHRLYTPAMLAELLGVDRAACEPDRVDAYRRHLCHAGTFDMYGRSAPGTWLAESCPHQVWPINRFEFVAPRPGTEVVADVVLGVRRDDPLCPAVMCRELGDGRVVYLAAPVEQLHFEFRMPIIRDLLGAIVALIIYVSSILTFVSRLVLGVRPGHWIGYPLLLMVFPLGYLLLKAPQLQRPMLYYIQVGLMLVWLIVLFLVDYVLKVDFRQTQWMVISYVVLYFAGIGGMIGVAAQAGRAWTISAIILFLISAVLAFVQRAVTGF